MNNLNIEVLMQCPCSGGDGDANPLLLLAVFAGTWLLFNWIRMLMKSKGVSFMNKAGKIIIVVVLIAIVGIVIAMKQHGKNSESATVTNSNSDVVKSSEPQNSETPVSSQTAENSAKLPHLIDLGAGKCIPCKMMKPILDELTQNYNEQFKVTFIDVWENPDEAKGYNVKMIPTQVFYDAEGNELFRHEGFYSKEDILGKWKELGINIEKGADNETN